MKLVSLFCVCCILLANTGCTKQEKDVQESLIGTVETVPENGNNVVNTVPANNNIFFSKNVRIILKAEDTKGVTDIAEFFREYLKDATEEDFSRVSTIEFHQEYSPDGILEHLEGLGIIFPNLTNLTVSSNLISVDSHTLPPKLVNLNLSNNKIVSFDTEGLPQTLSRLDLSKNNLSSFDTEGLPQIITLNLLDLSKNNLSSFCVESPIRLIELNLSFNNLSSLDTSNFDTINLSRALISLNLSDNPIEGTFEVTQNIRDSGLGSLRLENTLISRITGLENLTVGGSLSCANSPIEDIEEFLKLEYFTTLIIPIPQRYSDEHKEYFINKMLEQHPYYTYWLSTVLFDRKEHLFFSHPSPE